MYQGIGLINITPYKKKIKMEVQENNPSPENERNCENQLSAVSEIKKKQKKPGIVHLTCIPRYMTVKKVREHFSEFGEVTRLFLKPEKSKKPGKPSKFFSEGWIEFARRKIARQVAECLNGTQVGGKRHTPYYDALWSIKYLSKFQWGHLSEAKVYEKCRKEQRMRAEIAKVKKEIDFYTRGFEKRKRLKRENKLVEKDLETRHSDDLQTSQAVTNSPNEIKDSAVRQSVLLRKVFGSNIDE